MSSKLYFRYCSSRHSFICAGARDAARASLFASSHGFARSVGSYAAVASDPDVEVVYVGVVATAHLEVVRIMLEGGWL